MRLLSGVKDTGGKFITAGTRIPVRIAECTPTISAKGGPCVDVWFQDDGDRSIKSRLSLSDNALWKVKTLVAACGVANEKLDLFDVDSEKHWRALIGRKLYIDVTKGAKYHDVVAWYSLAGNTMQTAQKEQSQSIEQRLRAASEAPIEPSYGPPSNDDDLPF